MLHPPSVSAGKSCSGSGPGRAVPVRRGLEVGQFLLGRGKLPSCTFQLRMLTRWTACRWNGSSRTPFDDPFAPISYRHNPRVPRRVERRQAMGCVSDVLGQAATGEVAETALVGDDAFAIVHAQDSAKKLNLRALAIIDALLRGDHHLLHGDEVSARQPGRPCGTRDRNGCGIAA
jgi:hypothetical protein